MAEFEYRDLTGMLHFGLLEYTRRLQEYSMDSDDYIAELEEQVIHLQETITKGEGPHYLKDASYVMQKYNELQIEYGKECGKNAKKDAIIEHLKEECERLKDENEELRQQIQEYEFPGPRVVKTRDRGGRFYSDIPKPEKEKKAHEMRQDGHSWAEIGKALDVAPDTAKQYNDNYKRRIERHYGRGENNAC